MAGHEENIPPAPAYAFFPLNSLVEVRVVVQEADVEHYYWVIGRVDGRFTRWEENMIGIPFYSMTFGLPDLPIGPMIYPDAHLIRALQVPMEGEIFILDEGIEYYRDGGVWAPGTLVGIFGQEYAFVSADTEPLEYSVLRRIRRRLD